MVVVSCLVAPVLTLPTDEDFVIIVIKVEDVLTFSEECTPAVAAAIPRAVEAVLAELEERESGICEPDL